ncbi:MAG: hypothetical protein AAF610_04250 [Pseudomonadota bacterium]
MDTPNRFIPFAAALTLAACATSTDTPQSSGPAIDPVERVRANAALDVFQALAVEDEWYGVYALGESAGNLERKRTVRRGQIEVVSTLYSENDSVEGFTITERFDAGAPHDATLLEIRYDDGSISRIAREAGGYVAEFQRDGQSGREPLFDFRFRLADALAPEIWVRDGVEAGDCISYPGYSLTKFSREFNRECFLEDTDFLFSGDEIDAVRTSLNTGVRLKRDKQSGLMLVDQSFFGTEIRLEKRAISTSLDRPGAPASVAALASW